MKQKPHILIVEDDQALITMFAEFFRQKKYLVDTATTGKQAREMISKCVYDLAVFDLKLPDMNGIDLLKLLKECSSDSMAVILSGHATIEMTLEAISHGAFDFLLKPVELHKLLIVVENGLEKRRITLQNKKLISELQISKVNLEAGIVSRTDQLKKSEHKFRSLYNNAPDVYYTVNTSGQIIDCNKMACVFFGLSKRALKSRHLLDLYTSDNFDLVTKMVPSPDGKSGKVRHQEVVVKRANGKVSDVEINSNLLYDENEKVIGSLTIQRDITLRKKTEEKLRESEERYKTIFKTADVALIEIDYSGIKSAIANLADKGIVDWTEYLNKNPDLFVFSGKSLSVVDINQAGIKLFNARKKEDMLGPIARFFADPTSEVHRDFLSAIIRGDANFTGESVYRSLTGNTINTIISLTLPRPGAKFNNLLVSMVDITDRKRTEEEKDLLLERLHNLNSQLETLAVTDGLTRLYNHRFFMETLEREFSRSQRKGLPLSLLMADIDNFKSFNDTYGHQLGDEILVKVADVFRNSRRGSDIVARYGGEEFVLLLPDTGPEQAMIVAEKLRTRVENASVSFKGGILKTTISLGLCSVEKNYCRKAKDLLILADKALYMAKDRGKNTVCVMEVPHTGNEEESHKEQQTAFDPSV